MSEVEIHRRTDRAAESEAVRGEKTARYGGPAPALSPKAQAAVERLRAENALWDYHGPGYVPGEIEAKEEP